MPSQNIVNNCWYYQKVIYHSGCSCNYIMLSYMTYPIQSSVFSDPKGFQRCHKFVHLPADELCY